MKSDSIPRGFRSLWFPATLDAFRKLHPVALARQPVILVTALGALVASVSLAFGSGDALGLQIALWLWFTVLFANFSESLAEGRGRAQAAALRRTRSDLQARRLQGERETRIPAVELRRDDTVVCEAGDMIPADGEVILGIATVDESAITGESAPVIRESGGDRSAVTGGTRVLSDRIVVRITAEPGAGFLDRMIHLVEGARRQRTPNEIALGNLIMGMTLTFLVVVLSLPTLARFSATQAGLDPDSLTLGVPILVALFVCLIPTTIGGLVSAIGISGMNRLIRRNIIATSGRAVEAAGDVDILLLDKTGTITLGNRRADALLPAPGVVLAELAAAARLASLADDTPEGRSIVALVQERHGLVDPGPEDATSVPFSAHTRMSGVDSGTGSTRRRLRKGAAASVRHWVEEQGGVWPPALGLEVDRVAREGGTPLVVADGSRVLGVVTLRDIVKPAIRARFAQLRRMGIRTVMVTGDNPLTAAAIAAESGVDDFIAQATPEMKLARIREEQSRGRLVAMAGDGTNDAPALAQADVGLAMNTGTQAAREAGNMVDLDSDPTKLIEVVEIGKELLVTRGALTTFSLANDVAKYFAIIPALFFGLHARQEGEAGPLGVLNFMALHSPQSAVLSAVVFNALVIMALIPLALRGVSCPPLSAAALLRRNLLIYGLGGLVAPFVGIKLCDLALVGLGLV